MPISDFVITGLVSRNSVAIEGAKVWAENLDSPKPGMEPYKDNLTYLKTDSNGYYSLSAANFSSAVTNDETMRVYCNCGGKTVYADVTIDTSKAGTVQNFAFKTSLAIGVADTPLASGDGALKHNCLRVGLRDGLDGI